MSHLLEPAYRLGANPLRRRISRDELGVVTFEFAQLIKQRVVLIVTDRGIVLQVVALVVAAQLGAELLGAIGGSAHFAPVAPASSSWLKSRAPRASIPGS